MYSVPTSYYYIVEPLRYSACSRAEEPSILLFYLRFFETILDAAVAAPTILWFLNDKAYIFDLVYLFPS